MRSSVTQIHEANRYLNIVRAMFQQAKRRDLSRKITMVAWPAAFIVRVRRGSWNGLSNLPGRDACKGVVDVSWLVFVVCFVWCRRRV